MLVIAAIGLFANFVVILLLHRDTRHSLNIRSAVLHVVGDATLSVGVIIAGLAMTVAGWFWVDPVLSLLITATIAYHAARIAWEAAHILMKGVPRGVNTQAVRDALMALPNVRHVHDLHIWSLCSSCRYLSAHLVVDDDGLSDPVTVLHDDQTMLQKRFSFTTLHCNWKPTNAPTTTCAKTTTIPPKSISPCSAGILPAFCTLKDAVTVYRPLRQ